MIIRSDLLLTASGHYRRLLQAQLDAGGAESISAAASETGTEAESGRSA